MRAAIHQLHYFPWLGYFDKMAKADAFVLLDEARLEKGSPMIRSRVLDPNGAVKFLTVSEDTRNFLNREYRALLTKDVPVWTERQLNALRSYYRKAPGAKELFPILEAFFRREYSTICQWACASIELVREKFAENGVNIVFQDFRHPVYPQCGTREFFPGVSVLDMLFNLGVEESRRVFWETARSAREFEGSEG